MDHAIDTACVFTVETACHDDFAAAVFKVTLGRGKPIRIHEYLCYHYSDQDDAEQIRSSGRLDVDGFVHVLEQHRSDVGQFWSRADVNVEARER